ncbi:MAG: trigger factor [Clostridiales bacterium]
MNVKIEKTDTNIVELEIEVVREEFNKGMQKSFLKNAGKFNVPGFRKGKAPRNIIERHYGEEVLYEDAFKEVYPDAYDSAIDKEKIFPVDVPEISIVQIGKDKDLIFKAKVTVKPEVEIGDYKGIEAKKTDLEVTDEDVKNELDKVIESNARLISIEDRPVKDKDTVIINFEGFIDEVAFEGGKGENYELVIGSKSFIDNFEEQLIGKNLNEDIEINVTFPENYQKQDLAGKPAKFYVKILEIKEKELPEVDDEFAMDVSEFNTLDEYKESLKEKIKKEKDEKAKTELENQVLEKISKNSSVEIPEVMIKKRIDNLLYNYELSLRYQGLDLEKYLKIMGMEEQQFRDQFKDKAREDIKSQLILEKISKIEKIEASDDDYEKYIKEAAEKYKQTEEDFKKNLKDDDIDYIKENLIIKNTINYLVDNAVII